MKEKNKRSFKDFLPLLVLILISVVLGGTFGMWLSSHDEIGPIQLIFVFAALYVSFILHTIIHEAGHLIFGIASGYGFCSFRIFSFTLIKQNGKLCIKRMSIAGTAGQCLMVPPEPKDGKIPVLMYNLGGVIINLIASVIAIILYFPLAFISLLSTFLLIFAVIGIVSALSNGIPIHTSTVDNDGYNAIALSKDPEASRAFYLQLKVNEQETNGIRTKDMPKEWFEVPEEEKMKNSMIAALAVFACGRLMDEHKFKEADELMEHIMSVDSGIVGIHRSLMTCDRIYIELITKNRPDVLNGMLTKDQKAFMKAMRKFPSVIRTEYAYAILSDRDRTKADALRDTFEKQAKSYLFTGEIAYERELMLLAEEANCRRGSETENAQRV